ncbi:MAG: hypothetical protein JSR59_06000 [Proteobacteria bacterium]|nr:hypothetical protein [Pseudomonadota bacterium]
MNPLRIYARMLLALIAGALAAGCAEAPHSYGAAPIISGVPSGYDTRKEEARGR